MHLCSPLTYLCTFPKVVNLLRDSHFPHVVLGLLYHISIEEENKSVFTYTDVIPIIFNMMMSAGDLRSTPELIALAVNLTQNQRNAEVGNQVFKIEVFNVQPIFNPGFRLLNHSQLIKNVMDIFLFLKSHFSVSNMNKPCEKMQLSE